MYDENRKGALVEACAAAGITSSGQLIDLINQAEDGKKALAELRTEANMAAGKALGAAEAIGVVPVGASAAQLRSLIDHYRQLTPGAQRTAETAAVQREQAATAPAIQREQTAAAPRDASLWSRLTAKQQQYASKMGYATDSARETFASNVLKTAGVAA